MNALVKNYLDEPLEFHVQRQNGPAYKGKISPGTHADMMNLNVGDELYLRSRGHYTKEVFNHGKNHKYIVGYPHHRHDILFKHRGYNPIIMYPIQEEVSPKQISTVIVKDESPSHTNSDDRDNKIFILALMLIVVLGVGLLFSIMYIAKTKRSVGGTQNLNSDFITSELNRESILI